MKCQRGLCSAGGGGVLCTARGMGDCCVILRYLLCSLVVFCKHINSSLPEDCCYLDDHARQTTHTPRFKLFTLYYFNNVIIEKAPG